MFYSCFFHYYNLFQFSKESIKGYFINLSIVAFFNWQIHINKFFFSISDSVFFLQYLIFLSFTNIISSFFLMFVIQYYFICSFINFSIIFFIIQYVKTQTIKSSAEKSLTQTTSQNLNFFFFQSLLGCVKNFSQPPHIHYFYFLYKSNNL